ncbi:MAG: GNAT family N-acetyltransferase, partial [Chloroflexi bacterium]|nr:GNAT family N-acetyltransferase [Chloroflexota bacterium]
GDGTLGGTVFVRVNETRPHDTFIGAMWVDPNLRGGPAARELLAAAERFAAAAGSESCELWVEADNHPARQLYEAHGYVETGVALPGRRGVQTHLLQKYLDPAFGVPSPRPR